MAPLPTPKLRTWCKSCKEFTVHVTIDNNVTCETCSEITTGYQFSDVPDDKLLEQRLRYQTAKQKYLMDTLQPSNIIQDILNEDKYTEARIIECDAGQKHIDEHRKQAKYEQTQKNLAIATDYRDNYSKLGRNDKCSCGSGQKYKQCHLLEFRKTLNI